MIERLPKLFLEKLNITDTCWLWTGAKNSKGYGSLKRNSKSYSAHRFCWEQINGEILGGLFVLHKCDVPLCVNPDHLFLGTYQDNSDDKIRKGRMDYRKGESNANAKLTQEQVNEIRKSYIRGTNVASEFSTNGLARKYGVKRSVVVDILKNKLWKSA